MVVLKIFKFFYSVCKISGTVAVLLYFSPDSKDALKQYIQKNGTVKNGTSTDLIHCSCGLDSAFIKLS